MNFLDTLKLIIVLGFASLTANAQPTLVETFDTNEHGWPFLGKGDGFEIKLDQGHLSMQSSTSAIHTYKDVGLSADKDFGIYTRQLFLQGTHLGWMGIRYSMSMDTKKYCSFFYNNGQGFFITVNNGKKEKIIRESQSTVIKPYDYNTLTVLKSGSTYRFLINDKQVHEAKISDCFGPGLAIFTSANMSILVDEVQVFESKKGKQRTIPSVFVKNVTEKDVTSMVLSNTQMTPDFKEFYDSFQKYAFPYNYELVIGKAKVINQLPFVQKNYFEYLGNTRGLQIWAIALLSQCHNGYAFLMANHYSINNQVNTRFSVEVFDLEGNPVGSKDLGAFVEEGGKYFKTLDFRISQSGNSILIETAETFYNGNKTKDITGLNYELCTW